KGLHGLVATRRPLEPDLGAAQRDMLLGVFTLADTRVDEVMTSRLDMVAVDLAAPGDEVIEAFRQSEHSRLPVYDGTPDSIAGVVFAKDLVPFAMGLGGGGGGGAARWPGLLRPAAFVPGTETLDRRRRGFRCGRAGPGGLGAGTGWCHPAGPVSSSRANRQAALPARRERAAPPGRVAGRRGCGGGREPARPHPLGVVQAPRGGRRRRRAREPGAGTRNRQCL